MLFGSRSRIPWPVPVLVASVMIGLSALGPPALHLLGSGDTRRDPSMPGSCTIFCVSKGDSVFFGNNEDWKNPQTYVWVEPRGDGKYGVLCVGFDDLGPQGGVNEKGLAFDGNALPYIPIRTHPEKPQPKEPIVNRTIMHNCATVEEAIAMARSYDWGTIYSGKFAGQYLLADATGDACVLGFGADGELAITRKPKGDGFIVSTNFNRVLPENRYYGYPCPRYDKATAMLGRWLNEGSPTPESLASVLDAVHQEGRAPTLYSNVFDLKNGIAYFYDRHQYDRVAKLNVAETIAAKPPARRIKDLFSPFSGSRVAARIAAILKESGASGVAAAVAKDGKIVWEQGFGFTSHDGKTPVTPDTMFSLASITKAMTATGLMVLVEKSLIDLDKPANDYLGAAKLTAGIEGSPPATVRNLIYHTSGLPMHYRLFYADKPLRAPAMDEEIGRYGILVGPPGESYCYSNFGYGILGHILARVSGKTYAAFMKQEIFDPLGMTRTAILTEPGGLENVAVKFDAGKRMLPVCDFDHQGASAAYSSVHDLVRFGLFHLNGSRSIPGRILKDATLAAMHRDSGSEFMDGDRLVKYLLGSFAQLDYLGYRFNAVTGGMPGAVSRLDIIPSENLVLAVLANSDGVDLWSLQHEILAEFLPAFRDAPGKPPAAAGAGTGGAFSSPVPLLGVWKGAIRTSVKELPAALHFIRGGGATLEIDGRKYSPLPVKTDLGEMSFKDGVFSGVFWGRIDAPDTTGQAHVVYINVKVRGKRLTGSATAVSIDPRRSFALPFWIELDRSAG